MKIEYSLSYDPMDLKTINNVVSYIHTKQHCIILGSEGVLMVLNEDQIEDFTIHCED